MFLASASFIMEAVDGPRPSFCLISFMFKISSARSYSSPEISASAILNEALAAYLPTLPTIWLNTTK